MNKLETNHLIRWVLLIPGTLATAALTLACGLAISALLISIADAFIIVFFILPSTTAIAWIIASYYIVPSHRITVIWISYMAGNLFIVFWLPSLMLWVFASIGGLLACLRYSKTNQLSAQRYITNKNKGVTNEQ